MLYFDLRHNCFIPHHQHVGQHKGQDEGSDANHHIHRQLVRIVNIHQRRQQHRQSVTVRLDPQQRKGHASQSGTRQHHADRLHTGAHHDPEQRRFADAQHLGNGRGNAGRFYGGAVCPQSNRQTHGSVREAVHRANCDQRVESG